MHPDICAFVSERSYDRRLHSRNACSMRRITATSGTLTGNGLRAIAVEHSGRSQASPEEASAVASACSGLLAGATVTDDEGNTRPLVEPDILVVAPYNLAVHDVVAQRTPILTRVDNLTTTPGIIALRVGFRAADCDPQSFSGNGGKNIGTIDVASDSTIRWTDDGGLF